MCMTVLKCVLLVDINVTEINVNCGLWNACCSASKLEIISLAFKWLSYSDQLYKCVIRCINPYVSGTFLNA